MTDTINKPAAKTPSERIDEMLLAGATESSDITAVLNERYDEVVFVPSNLLPSLKLGLCEDSTLLIIDHRDYSDIADELDLDNNGDDVSRAYFVNRFRRATGYGTAWISRKGWAEIFDYLKESGMTVQSMFKDMGRVANSFQENTPADVLDNLDIDSSNMTNDEKTEAATLAIHAKDTMTFIESYEVDGITQLLYSES